MSDIDNGIKQPLRFYDDVEKQNWRKCYARDAGLKKEAVLVCPQNAIVPFQIRRRRNPNPVTVFDLYTWNGTDFEYDLNLLTNIPAPTTNHLKIIQMQTTDNIVWFPQADFINPIACGLHYVHVSDGTNNWYSEVFQVINGFTDNTTGYISTFHGDKVTGTYVLGKNPTAGNEIISRNKPF